MSGRGPPITTIHDVLADEAVTSVFQPIVDLDSGAVVAYEALARGPEGPLRSPVELFAAARAAGRLAELDAACRTAAFRGAVEQGLLAPLTVFVNVEPEVLDSAPLADLLAIAESAPSQLRVVVEITERAIAARPAELLQTVQRIREIGWGLALDDVGADAMSLAFMPLLRPDVVKLDLRLVQDRPGPEVAEVMNAVNAYAERTGAVVLAEGIETDAHLVQALALGATLGQGWMFGRPQPGPAAHLPTGELLLPPAPLDPPGTEVSPFGCLPPGTVLRRSPKKLLIELSKQLERHALRLGETAVVASTFQEARHFTPSTVARYRGLAERTGFVCALGDGLSAEPVAGVRGAELSVADEVRGEWDVAVIAPHFSAALLARDLGDTGPDLERTFEFALTYDRDTVARAAHALVARVVPREQRRAVPVERTAAAATAPRLPELPALAPAAGEGLLHRALAATTSGVVIVDMDLPDQPLVYVNRAFEELSGYPREEVLGRNCRFLQTADTDLAAVSRIREALDAGRECRETLLNHRGPDRTPWWNELHLAPVTDAAGRVVQYIGVQNDVTARVEAQQRLAREQERTRQYLARIEQLAWTDPLTGLPNRRRLQEQVELALWEADAAGTAVGLLFVDLDGFKAVNDRLGHAAGDELLVEISTRLRSSVRRTDLLARLGGDEFLVALPGLAIDTAAAEAARVAATLATALGEPVDLRGEPVRVGASIGCAVSPDDGAGFEALLHTADQRMYLVKGGPLVSS
ncbi:diguanylate cyclase domain-containing protein [Klenkia brasiliensis]|uniref:PAS domain S-box-containing protein/diguanylate cyclase (GGDEF) domain-containing protein n=1 Tax=Klenkia brasiliensis TaxID=333142 RepID=A0A1G7QJZ1_9ACTN|nr:diguanylate cyclase [Klenkia brasiliensis]SDF98798.1 PAS domain S-box-containing protein/diguanylate cyclase (GGDEF) domain-containing protein [Klenkia brasiliensis]